MCIIAIKKEGNEMMDKRTLQNCWEMNSDGAGFMYADNGKVKVEKGFDNFNKFYKRLVELDNEIDFTDKNLVMHFRISTSGQVDRGNTHPYPISNKIKDLRNLKYETDLAMVHNGIIVKHEPKKNSVMNDTQHFIKDFVTPMYKMNSTFLHWESNLNLLEKEAQSKLCFLDKDNELFIIGHFIEEENGNLFSNSTYLDMNAYDYYGEFAEDFAYECDVFDYSDKELTLQMFIEVLEALLIPDDCRTLICDDLNEYVCKGEFGIDGQNTVYYIDYDKMRIEYLGELVHSYAL